jgi:polysaccharide export outer membrane protein
MTLVRVHRSLKRAAGHSAQGAGVLLLSAAALLSPKVSRAQNPQAQTPWSQGASDVGTENQSYVAASAVDIENVLRTSPGLMIQLKHWVAQEATQQGRIVGENDLTDMAIQERLREDTKFRAIATELLQRYGYLTPKIDPSSQLARENEILIAERAKWRVQEQELARLRTRGNYGGAADACDPPADPHCPGATRLTRDRVPSNEPIQPPLDALPMRPSAPSSPPNRSGGTLELAANHDFRDDSARDSIFGEGSNWYPLDADALESSTGTNRSAKDSTSVGNGGAAASQYSSDDVLAGVPRDRPEMDSSERPYTDSRIEPSSQPIEPRSAGMSRSPNAAKERESDFNANGMVPTTDPYADIPSLVDMYVQASPQSGALRRFGSDVFQLSARDTQKIPMDLPVGPEYVVGPGDSLAIDLWGGTSRRFVSAVDREGRLSLPEVGPVLVSGKSLGEVQETVQQVLRSQFRDISAEVSLARLRMVRVYVVGDVERPGAYDVSSLSTPLNALFSAGGPTARGSLRVVEHYRGKQLVQEVDLYALLLHGMKSDLARLENGDTILVPPIGPGVTVEGMVRRPAIYELHGEKSLDDVLQLAGGILPSAALDHIEVERLEDHQKRTMVSLSVAAIQDGNGVRKQLESFGIQDQDIIRLFPIASFNQEAVYLEGHVLRSGRYAYHDGMKFTDVVTAYSDLMPEPAQKYAEIIHLNPPDYRPSVESFNLGDIFAGRAAAPILKPMDTIRVFGKYDFESVPMVSVWGEVRRPGSYRVAGEIRVRDALHVAGGSTPDSLMDSAQIFRTLPDSTLKVFSVDLKRALLGDPDANIVLQPRDRVIVDRNPAKVDPPAVYVKGEIAKPGRYPLTAGMRISDLVQVGGGLRRSADDEVASLAEFHITGAEQVVGEERTVNLAAALAGDSNSDFPVRDGDTLTIRKITGWDERGAAITVRGEVQHPGTFGIQPGERLTAILERAGGFTAAAYPRGAVLERLDVRDEEERSQRTLIARVQEEEQALNQLPEGTDSQKAAKAAAIAQWRRTLDDLVSNPPIGRLVIRITANTRSWRNTPDDVPVRAGDVLIVPKTPNFVLVTGQVYNPTAIAYRPGRDADWYLGQGGGPTHIADKKAIFVICADGSVISSASMDSMWRGDALHATLQPGDTVVVPEKAVGRSISWQTVFLAGQVASSVATAVLVSVRP